MPSLYLRIGRTYLLWARSLLPLAVIVFVPLGLIHAIPVHVDVTSLDLEGGLKILALAAAVLALATTGLIGEVFYTGAVAIALTHPRSGGKPPTIREVARMVNYRRLIAVDLLYGAAVALGLVAFVLPGLLLYVYLGLAAPVVEIERRPVRAALKRSYRLVRGHFWLVLAILVPIEIAGDGLTNLAISIGHSLFGGSLLAEWLADTATNIAFTPFYAVAAVLLTLDLIADEDGVAPATTLRSEFAMTSASVVIDLWNDQIVAEGKEGLVLVFAGFILSFSFIRMSTRLMRSPRVPWWPGSVVSESGVHVHHLAFGIVAMMIAGAVGFTALGEQPYTDICAFVFGVGMGLTIDEFALWIYLDDVYWAEEGRSSIDATVIAASAMFLILIGLSPFSFETGSVAATLGSVLTAAIVLWVVAICFFKQRVMHGTIGFFFFPLAIYGAARIGKPGSPWARRRYGERRPKKQAKAEERFKPDRHTERLKNAARDIIGGKPSEGVAAVKDEVLASSREAAEEFRDAAKGIAGGSADKERRKRDD